MREDNIRVSVARRESHTPNGCAREACEDILHATRERESIEWTERERGDTERNRLREKRVRVP